jgi:hypothetical protein
MKIAAAPRHGIKGTSWQKETFGKKSCSDNKHVTNHKAINCTPVLNSKHRVNAKSFTQFRNAILNIHNKFPAPLRDDSPTE